MAWSCPLSSALGERSFESDVLWVNHLVNFNLKEKPANGQLGNCGWAVAGIGLWNFRKRPQDCPPWQQPGTCSSSTSIPKNLFRFSVDFALPCVENLNIKWFTGFICFFMVVNLIRPQLKNYDPRKSSTRQFVPKQVKTNEPDEKGVKVTSKNKVVENPVSTVNYNLKWPQSASKQPRRSQMASELSSVASTTYVAILSWSLNAPMA